MTRRRLSKADREHFAAMTTELERQLRASSHRSESAEAIERGEVALAAEWYENHPYYGMTEVKSRAGEAGQRGRSRR